MGEAAQRLMDTGAFKDIETTVDGPFAGVSVIFKLKPDDPANFLPVVYQNFVWFSTEERDADIRQHVPLYTGRIPAAGTMQAAVQQALTQMLTAKGITATVDAETRTTSTSMTKPSMFFRVSQPQVVLDQISLTGLPPAAEQLRKTSAIRPGVPYGFGSEADLTQALLSPFENAGYIDAHIESLKLQPQLTGNTVLVGVTGVAVLGDPYRLGTITWAGSPVYSTAQFAKDSQLRPGEAVSLRLLEQAKQALVTAYLGQGYLDSKIDAVATRDTALHTVSYTMQATAGPVYHVGSITAVGLSPAARQDFDTSWKLQPGAVYDANYPVRYLGGEEPVSLKAYTGSISAIADPNNHTADVTITFIPTR